MQAAMLLGWDLNDSSALNEADNSWYCCAWPGVREIPEDIAMALNRDCFWFSSMGCRYEYAYIDLLLFAPMCPISV
eukprot:9886017-Ditylum_brightwellii.AAC.1